MKISPKVINNKTIKKSDKMKLNIAVLAGDGIGPEIMKQGVAVMQAIVLGARVEAGHLYNRLDGLRDDDLYGGAIYLTGRTLVGPLTLGIAGTSTDSWSLWLSVGRPIGRGTILEKGIFR